MTNKEKLLKAYDTLVQNEAAKDSMTDDLVSRLFWEEGLVVTHTFLKDNALALIKDAASDLEEGLCDDNHDFITETVMHMNAIILSLEALMDIYGLINVAEDIAVKNAELEERILKARNKRLERTEREINSCMAL
jgi:hypothetical protein